MLKRYISWLPEVLIILATLVVINNFLGNKEQVIKADGKGYYDYLPATFIYHDINFTYTDTLQTDYYNQKTESQGYLKTINGKQVNKYFPGVSILWAPFFLGAHTYSLATNAVADGYSWPYQKSIFYAAIFYLFIGLVFMRKWLSLLKVPLLVIFILQGLLVFATPLIHYVQFDPSFTHAYSFSLITAFSYYILRFTRDEKPLHLMLSALILGVIVIIRPVNILAFGVFFLCFSSLEELKNFVANSFKNQKKSILLAALVFAGVISIVPIMWFIQTGSFLVWGYQDEGFNFMSPAFFDFLFSFRKGAFTHTPLLFILFFGGLMALISKREWYKLGAYLGVFGAVVYVLSSWWSWWYGASFGSRPMIDYYVIFAFGGAYMYNVLKPWWSKITITMVMVLLVPVNIIQAYQYQNYIMDWGEMSYEKFRKIGLQTDFKYQGMFYQTTINYGENDVVFSKQWNLEKPIHLASKKFEKLFSLQVDSTINMSTVTHVVVEMDVSFNDATSEIILGIEDTLNAPVYWHNPTIFRTAHEENKRKTTSFVYGVKNLPENCIFNISINTETDLVTVYGVKMELVRL